MNRSKMKNLNFQYRKPQILRFAQNDKVKYLLKRNYGVRTCDVATLSTGRQFYVIRLSIVNMGNSKRCTVSVRNTTEIISYYSPWVIPTACISHIEAIY
jgi:hypothetical protein